MKLAPDYGTDENTQPVTRHTMHRGTERLPPSSRYVLLMQSRKGFTTAQHVEERTDRAGIRREEHKSPLQHRLRPQPEMRNLSYVKHII